MPQGSDYIFAIQDKNFNFWKVAEDKSISISAQPYFLDFSPAGWDDIAIQNIRNKVYKSVDRAVTVPLGYVNDGAQIMKQILYSLGNHETTYLVIASQQLKYEPGVSYGYWYKQVYRGEVDWSTFDHDGPKVACTTLEDGLPKYLKANDKTVYEFPMADHNAIQVKYDGIILHEKLSYLMVQGIQYVYNRYSPAFSFLSNEGNSSGIYYAQQGFDIISGAAGADETYFRTSPNYFLKNVGPVNITIHIAGQLRVICAQNGTSPPSSSSLKIRTSRDNGFGSTMEYSVFNFTPVAGVSYPIDVSMDITVFPDERLFMYGQTASVNDTLYKFEFMEGSNLAITFTSRYPATYILAFRPQYLWELLVQKVTEGAYTAAVSAYFERYKRFVFTCGNAIRQLAGCTMKISLDMFFKFWDSIDSVGLIDKKPTVDFDSEENLIDLDDLIDLPEPAQGTFKVSMAKDLLINEIDIGYPEIRNDVGALNGNQEYNTKFVFSIDATTTTGKLDKISPIKTSCYDQEAIRINTAGKDTTDYKSDNDVYAVHIEDTENLGDFYTPFTTLRRPSYWKLDRSLNPLVTAGLIEAPSVFNLVFTPKRSINRQGMHLHGRFFKADSMIFYYRSSDKNKDLVCDGVVEAANFHIGDLTKEKLVPIYFDMDMPPPFNLNDLLDMNPLQGFRFPLMGRILIGTLEKISISPSKLNSQSIQLRSATTNDHLSLIKYYGG